MKGVMVRVVVGLVVQGVAMGLVVGRVGVLKKARDHGISRTTGVSFSPGGGGGGHAMGRTMTWATPSLEEVLSRSTTKSVVEELMTETAEARKQAGDLLPAGADGSGAEAEAWLLRFVAGKESMDVDQAVMAVKSSIEWRENEGRSIVESARDAYQLATKDARWNNDPVLAAAPHSSAIAEFFTPAKLLTLKNAAQDGLIYIIRAGQVDDRGLMAQVSSDQLADFFLYAKAVNERVAADLAVKTGKLSAVVTVNDLAGVDLFGDTRFRDALSAASKKADAIFPGLAAETILLNLPKLVQALVKVFTPLFPPSVQKKLKFAAFDIASPDVLVDRSSPGRADFLEKVDAQLQGGGGKK